MYILIITLYSVIGVSHPVELKGDPPHPYPSLDTCLKAGKEVEEWLSQEFMKVKFDCMEVRHENVQSHNPVSH